MDITSDGFLPLEIKPTGHLRWKSLWRTPKNDRLSNDPTNVFVLRYIGTSVNRFGEILPLWINFKSLWNFLRLMKNLAKFWSIFGTYCSLFTANIHCYKRPHIEQIFQPSGHTGFRILGFQARLRSPSPLFKSKFIFSLKEKFNFSLSQQS